jgi:hypothetical protein
MINSTIAGLIASANAWRKETAIAVIEALEKGQKPDTAALSQHASRPVALGFSDNDLAYWRDRFCSRMPEYDGMFNRAMATVKKLNVRGSRDPLSQRDRTQRDAEMQDAKWARARMNACLDFNRIVTKVMEQREIAARPAPKVTPETVVIVQAAPTPAPTPVFKKKAKHVVKTAPKARCEIKLRGFEELREYQQNMEICAQLSGTYHGE